MADRVRPGNHKRHPDLAEKLEKVLADLTAAPDKARKVWGKFVCDIAAKSQHYDLSSAQVKAVKKALKARADLEQIPDWATGKGRHIVTGEVLSLKTKRSYRGNVELKMLVKTTAIQEEKVTCKLYGRVPSDLEDRIAEGAKVTFTASISKSDDDPKFGFFNNPRKASFIGDMAIVPDEGPLADTIETVKDVASRCGWVEYNPNGDELICIADKHDSYDEPHEFVAVDDVEKMLVAAGEVSEETLPKTGESERVYPKRACARCGPDGMAQPEHIFDALGNVPWTYDDSIQDIVCDCCGERIEQTGPGPVDEDKRCNGMCGGAGKSKGTIPTDKRFPSS